MLKDIAECVDKLNKTRPPEIKVNPILNTTNMGLLIGNILYVPADVSDIYQLRILKIPTSDICPE